MAATSSDASDGPLMSVINKRLRALRKKLNRILQMEESVAQGKLLNEEQQQVLRSKPTVSALIEELEKLRDPLSSALNQELTLALQNHQQPQPQNDDVVEDLLKVVYFGSLFDVKSQNEFTSTMLTRTHERGCCLTYDYVTDDATDLLAESDLDSLSSLAALLVSRPADSSLSHENALRHCIHHAKLWLAAADQPIGLTSDSTTYAGLRDRLKKIMSSEYFTTTPEMKAPSEVAAAAAAGSYGSFQVPVQDSVPVEVEGSSSQSLEKDEGTANFEGHGSGEDNLADLHGEPPKEEAEAENAVDEQQTKPHTDLEHNHKDVEVNEQQYHPRRGFQNQRGGRGGGGGRRGYSNGRGGYGGSRGGYQNGRNQYYDQPGNYYPRNNYYNYRGRGSKGGGHSYNNHGAGDHVNHVAGHVGVQS